MEAKVVPNGSNPSTILTLELDSRSQAFFEALRQKHYPPELNRIPAHLTLFHKLPPHGEITEAVHRAAQHSTFQMKVVGLRSLGRGVAYSIQSPELTELRKDLAQVFAEFLTAQDKQRFWPHIVVQNKVVPAVARTLLAELETTFSSFEVQATGLQIWNYLGGPWEPIGSFKFS